MGAYVKFVESAGGIPVPFQILKMTDNEIRNFVSRVNGLLIPGGGSSL